MPDFIASTRAIKGGSFSCEPGPAILLKVKDEWNPGYSHELHSSTPNESVLKLTNVKRGGLARRAERLILPESALAKAVGVDCAARFLETQTNTNPVVDPISHAWYFDDHVFLKDITFIPAGDMDRIVNPKRLITPTLSLALK